MCKCLCALHPYKLKSNKKKHFKQQFCIFFSFLNYQRYYISRKLFFKKYNSIFPKTICCFQIFKRWYIFFFYFFLLLIEYSSVHFQERFRILKSQNQKKKWLKIFLWSRKNKYKIFFPSYYRIILSFCSRECFVYLWFTFIISI